MKESKPLSRKYLVHKPASTPSPIVILSPPLVIDSRITATPMVKAQPYTMSRRGDASKARFHFFSCLSIPPLRFHGMVAAKLLSGTGKQSSNSAPTMPSQNLSGSISSVLGNTFSSVGERISVL
jgi:hypothetical protein